MNFEWDCNWRIASNIYIDPICRERNDQLKKELAEQLNNFNEAFHNLKEIRLDMNHKERLMQSALAKLNYNMALKYDTELNLRADEVKVWQSRIALQSTQSEKSRIDLEADEVEQIALKDELNIINELLIKIPVIVLQKQKEVEDAARMIQEEEILQENDFTEDL